MPSGRRVEPVASAGDDVPRRQSGVGGRRTARKVRGHGGRAMQEERKNGGNGGAESGEPQFTTPGAGEQLDETGAPGEPAPGPMEGQAGGRAPKPAPAQPTPRRTSATERKGGATKP